MKIKIEKFIPENKWQLWIDDTKIVLREKTAKEMLRKYKNVEMSETPYRSTWLITEKNSAGE